MTDDISELTRSVYDTQHEIVAADEVAFRRLYDMYANAAIPIPAEWFEGKVALDAGCGNAGPFISWLFDQGIKTVYGVDLGDTWMEKLHANLERRGIDRSRLLLKPGNVRDIPYPDETFDFVTINGVLIHLNNMDEIREAFREGARVLKPGGYYYTVYGIAGGAFMDAIFPALRQYYHDNAYFKEFIDTISPEVIHDTIDFALNEHRDRTGEAVDPEAIKPLFGVEFCIFLQNYIQRPTDFSSQCTPEFVESLYEENGFTDVTRLHYFVKRTDVRKFSAPLHYKWDHPVSKALYGQGSVQYLGIKK
jgi:ubiquinone/menaquinone biosynthesis C-methylase UbiE